MHQEYTDDNWSFFSEIWIDTQYCRGVPNNPTVSKMEFFVTLINDWWLLTNATKNFILVISVVLDTPLIWM